MVLVNQSKVLKTKRMKTEEARLGKPLEVIIPETYEKLGSLEAASQALGINLNTMYSWMNRLGICISKKVVMTR
ncbi:MAG: hypothetical protein JW967_01665 [Dehalococcoidales bacterium]|nr:hypothetical protein [Dehalococcoidales bacterium]